MRARLLIVALAFSCGCQLRARPARDPVYDDVAPVLERACGSCHAVDPPADGYRVDSYLRAIACPDGAGPAASPADPSAPLVAVLATPDHAGLLSPEETALVTAWVEAGSPPRLGAAHASGWADPRSPDFHGQALYAERWRRMLDGSAPDSCARCHAGLPAALADAGPAADAGPRGTAPGATPCTSCHTAAEGPLACPTCHGAGDHAYPPRDACFHPGEAGRAGAHARHTAVGIGCAVCHGERTAATLGTSEHGDGQVQVRLDPARAGDGAAFDPMARTCATRCHDRGGSTSAPSWMPGAGLDCNSCHTSPPAGHYAGTCDRCHAEASADGASLVPGPLHANGTVDLGDGSGTCGACHGAGDDPMPRTGSHAAHTRPALTAPIGCDACHLVPTDPRDPGHLDGTVGAEVTFGTLASARGASPAIAAGTCSDVACHGSGLPGGTWTSPRWGATDGLAGRCGACHAVPPPPPHTTASTCAATTCHGGYVTPGPGISEAGRAVHVNGSIDLWPGP